MKITIDISQMAYLGSGVSRYTYNLVEALLNLDSPHQFLLWAGALRQRPYFRRLARTLPWSHASWRILPVPPKLAGLALNTLNLPFEWLAGETDLIHTSDWSEPSARAPKVTTVHDLVFKKYSATLDPLIRATQERRFLRLAANQTQIIADSKSTKVDLLEYYHLDPGRISVVYPGVSPRYCPESHTEIERVKIKYKLPDQYLLSLGAQEPRKNTARLIEAIEGLDLPLVIVGKYGWGAPIIPSVKGSHLPRGKAGIPGMSALGYVPEADLPALYSGASAFLYPSLYEGFGFPVLEAMACGTPVVTSNTSSLPEVVGQAGVLVDPLNTASITAGIKQALSSRDKLSTLGLIQAKQFTWGKTAKQVMEVYEKITSGH